MASINYGGTTPMQNEDYSSSAGTTYPNPVDPLYEMKRNEVAPSARFGLPTPEAVRLREEAEAARLAQEASKAAEAAKVPETVQDAPTAQPTGKANASKAKAKK